MHTMFGRLFMHMKELVLSDWLAACLQIQTEKMGDIHHFAWRARFRNQTIYINKRDGERFGDWESLQCSVRQQM